MKRFLKDLAMEAFSDKPTYAYLDLYRTAVAFKGYEFAQAKGLSAITPAIVDSFHAGLEGKSEMYLDEYVNGAVTTQVKSLFSKLHARNVQGPARRLDAGTPANDVHKFPFRVEVRPSRIPGAGNGVFLRHDGGQDKPIVPGTVVALYPGLVHLKEHLRNQEYMMSLVPDPDLMLMTRIDQNFIDGRSADKCYPNPFAVAHKINHCGRVRPNVMQVSYDFPIDIIGNDSFPQELRYLIPNDYARPPSFIGRLELALTCMRSMVFIVTQPLLDDEELLMDYRLNPATNIPKWYETYNQEDAVHRWAMHEAQKE